MAKAAKKPAAKKATSKPAAKAKPEKKASAAAKKPAAPAKKAAESKKATPAPKKAAAPAEIKKETSKAPVKVAPVVEVIEEEEAEVVVLAPKMSKREKAAKAAADKIISEDLKKWSDFKEKYGSMKALPYSMSSTYEAHQALQHKVLGWGFILSVQNDRLEVLFESGPKMLISNYKPA